MILLSAGMLLLSFPWGPDAAIPAQERLPGISRIDVPRAAAASFGLLAGFLLLFLRIHMKSSEEGVRILLEALRSHGSDLPEVSDPRTAADAASCRLDLYREYMETALTETKVVQERRLLEITEAHNDLITHHKFTKKMLQSERAEEVYATLLAGVRDGLGFSGAILGVLEESGHIVFRDAWYEGNGEGPEEFRIPAWDEGSFLARVVWGGNAVMVPSLDGQRHREEDRAVLGPGSTLLVPVTRKTNRKCSDVKGCGVYECPAFSLVDAKCWIEGFPSCRLHSSEMPEEKRRECVRCEMFAVTAILVARSRSGSRAVTRETTGSIITLVNEATLSLEVVQLNENTRRMSVTDGLTGLANHREFYQTLRAELGRAKRYGHDVSLLMVDVDDFKKFNDRYGHLAGDFALKKIAGLLRSCVRANDTVARYGGEEFGIILPESTPSGALMLAERIKTEISRHDFMEDVAGDSQLTVSIGIFSAESGDVSEETMVKFADEAAYLAKNSGKNRVVVKTHA